MAQFLPARAEQVLQLGIVQVVLSKGLESVNKCFKFSSRFPYDLDGSTGTWYHRFNFLLIFINFTFIY